MDTKNLERAVELFGALIKGEEVNKYSTANAALYEAYNNSSEVADLLEVMLKKVNLRLYEHNYGLYVSPGAHNRVFGFTNDELKRVMGLRLNKELFLCYFIIYNIILSFYKDTAVYTYVEYVRIADVADLVSANLGRIMSGLKMYTRNELEENSFETLALLWDELPAILNEDTGEIRAGRGSKAGYVKLVFNFLLTQELFAEAEERYYPTERFHAIVCRYYEEERGRLYEILQEVSENRGSQAQENQERKCGTEKTDRTESPEPNGEPEKPQEQISAEQKEG